MSTTAQPELNDLVAASNLLERIAMATEGITKENANKVIVQSLEIYEKQRKASDLMLSLILAALMAKYQCEFVFSVKPLDRSKRIRIGMRISDDFRDRHGNRTKIMVHSPDRITIVIYNPFADDNQHREAIKTIWQGIAANEKEMNALITIRDEKENK